MVVGGECGRCVHMVMFTCSMALVGGVWWLGASVVYIYNAGRYRGPLCVSVSVVSVLVDNMNRYCCWAVCGCSVLGWEVVYGGVGRGSRTGAEWC